VRALDLLHVVDAALVDLHVIHQAAARHEAVGAFLLPFDRDLALAVEANAVLGEQIALQRVRDRESVFVLVSEHGQLSGCDRLIACGLRGVCAKRIRLDDHDVGALAEHEPMYERALIHRGR
jgi:hypothetical protein